jgi:hypothetical protein
VIYAGGDQMPDYKEMYLEMVRGTEKAINILIDVQQKCEEMYISSPDIPDEEQRENQA